METQRSDSQIIAAALTPEGAIATLLRYIGENPKREGLVDTPRRVLKAWREQTEGYRLDEALILQKDFDGAGYDQMIAVTDVDFYSNCEHHMLPFFGVAHVAYIPGKRVVGLSKLARLVDCFAKRLQIQERMTSEIADAIEKHLKPRGVAVVVKAQHFCMCSRGAQKQNAHMVTSALRGAFIEEGPARAEFFSLCSK